MTTKIEIAVQCPKCLNIGQSSGLIKEKKCFFNPVLNTWHCFQCQAAGAGHPYGEKEFNITQVNNVLDIKTGEKPFTFSEELLKAYRDELFVSPVALEYLRKRFGGLDDEALIAVCERLELGYDSGREMIVIPSREASNALVSVKYRAISDSNPKRYTHESGSKGLYLIKGEAPTVLVCEGEFDAISAHILGYPGTCVAARTNAIKDLEQFESTTTRIHLALDNDEAGQQLLKSMEALSTLKQKIAILSLPVEFKDLSEMLQAKGEGEAKVLFKKALSEAKTELEMQSYSVFDRLEETEAFLKNKLNTTGWPTGFSLLDSNLGGGLLPHMLTALSAPAKTGKTTVVKQMIFNLAKSGVKTGFLSLEMGVHTNIIPSLLSIGLKRNVFYLNKIGDKEVDKVLSEAREKLPFLSNVTFLDDYGTTEAEKIRFWIEGQHLEKGVSVFFLDHVGYSLKDIKDASEHSKLSKMLRTLTTRYPIHIVAIVQPKQVIDRDKAVTKHDLYGSVTWSQDISQLITLEKGKNGQTLIRLTDSHNPLAKCSDDAIILTYNNDTFTLAG